MRVCLILVLLALAVNLTAQSLLWKITGPDLPDPSYLLGTKHDIPASYRDRIAGLDEAFGQVSQFACEVCRDSLTFGIMYRLGREAVFMPRDTLLSKLLTKEEYQLVDDTVRKYMKKNLYQLSRQRPIFITMRLQKAFYKKYLSYRKSGKTLEEWLEKKARRKGYNVNGLDDVVLQLKRLKSISLISQAEMLVETARNPVGVIAMEDTLMRLYSAADLRGLEQLLSHVKIDIEKNYQATARNDMWLLKLSAYIRQKPTLIAVGIGHLIGETGLINQFRQLGYTVEPVN